MKKYQLHHVPIAGSDLNHEAVLTQIGILDESPGPYLAYCRTGGRSTIIWNVIKRMNKNV